LQRVVDIALFHLLVFKIVLVDGNPHPWRRSSEAVININTKGTAKSFAMQVVGVGPAISAVLRELGPGGGPRSPRPQAIEVSASRIHGNPWLVRPPSECDRISARDCNIKFEQTEIEGVRFLHSRSDGLRDGCRLAACCTRSVV
jgi:hypothetical protein